MMAILHGDKSGTSSRGDRVPKSVAGKYAGKGASGSAPESKGKEHEGGKWGEKHHAADKKNVDAKRDQRKKDKKARKAKGKERKASLHKAFGDFIKAQKNRGAGCLVINKDGQILLGRRSDTGKWATPGGHVEEGETFDTGALRELKEETGIIGREPQEIHSGSYGGFDSKTYLVESFRGKLKSNGEMLSLKFFDVPDVPWEKLTDYTKDAMANYIAEKLKKSKKIELLLAEEELKKNIMRGGKNSHIEFEMTHGDALKLVGNGTFRMLRNAVEGMEDEDFKELHFDNYQINIRKHMNDVYSGRITDGHKQIHQFTNKSLPQVAAELMSVFEWYLPEDEEELNLLSEEELNDDAIEGGLNSLVDKYRKTNIASMYHEMENIREEIRQGNAVDLQQVEQKMMKLFDKLESTIHAHSDAHNKLCSEAGSSIDTLEAKLLELQGKVDKLNSTPTTVHAVQTQPTDSSKVHSMSYPYLSKPRVEITPDGRISITFGDDWTHMERGDFLQDVKAKVVAKKGK
jgi:ADP-ribose pyrophosphatase YjhB (NUDIX family)